MAPSTLRSYPNFRCRQLTTQTTETKQFPNSEQKSQTANDLKTEKNASSKESNRKFEPRNAAVSRWLFACAGLVFGMVVVGGITRLTESGLSMTDWKPLVGTIPPLTEDEWNSEFERYKQFPEFQRQNYNMTLSEFKQIFFWEWAHRVYGRAIGVAFALPFAYFLARRRLPRREAIKLGGIFGLGGLQGLIGWWMVKSGLENRDSNSVARVSHLRLATHLGSAFVIYTCLLWQAMRWRPRTAPLPPLRDAALKPLRRNAHIAAALVFTTAMSGALVAGLDAGLIYNYEFPLMGGRLFPSDGWTLEPKWRNFIDNDAAVQFDHRWLAITTSTFILTSYALARRGGAQSLYRQLHPRGRLALNCLAAGVVAQASLGVATLMTFVPVPLGAAHQAGSLSLLSAALWLMHELKKQKVYKVIK